MRSNLQHTFLVAARAAKLTAGVERTAVVMACFIAGCVMPSHGTVRPVGANLVAASDVQPLKQAAASTQRHIGTALMSQQLADEKIASLVALHFNSLTPENEMKWEAVEKQPGVFSFAAGDKLVAFAAQNNMRMRGHTLVWHSQLAPWVKALSGEALRAAMVRHIQGVVSHWKGQIAQWDVVNEALADGPSGALRTDSPFTKLGPDFIDQAFRLAHELDPQAQLFYNDYDIEGEGSPKGDAAFRLCKRLKEAGVPIHGVGMQMHVDPRHFPRTDAIRRNMERYAALGLMVEFTEMDVPVGELPGTIDEKLQRQRVITHDLVAACRSVEKCTGITVWGLSDRDSWLSSPEWAPTRGNGPHYPLPFNTEYQPKPMLLGILDGLAGR